MGIVNRRHVGIAAAVAAAAVLSACSNSATPKPWTGGEPSPVSADVPVWADVTGQGFVRRDDPAKGGDQWSPTPIPGIKIGRLSATDPSGTAKCTLGPAVAQGFLTAGHCADGKPNTEQYAQVHPDGSSPLSLGVTETVQGIDAAVIRTGAGGTGATKIADTWPVAGVLTPAGVERLVPVGSYVCFDGAVSGVVCGPRMPDENGMVQFAFEAQHGDSGAPVFVVDPTTRRAALVGVVKSAGGSATDAVYMEAALLATGTAAKLDPHTEAFDGPSYSRRIDTK